MPDVSIEFPHPVADRNTQISGKPKRVRQGGRTGDEGQKFKIEATVHSATSTREAGNFFIKKFDDTIDKKTGQPEHPLMQQQKWSRLKLLDLPVTPTFRVDMEERQILMSDVTERGKKRIFDTNRTWSKHFPKIVNASELEEQVSVIADKAYDNGNGVWLSLDAYAIVVDKENRGKIMLLDLGIGSLLLKDGCIEGTNQSVNQDEQLSGAKEFVQEVLQGRGNPLNQYWAG